MVIGNLRDMAIQGEALGKPAAQWAEMGQGGRGKHRQLLWSGISGLARNSNFTQEIKEKTKRISCTNSNSVGGVMEIIVTIGDSVMWGQGLAKENKYSQIAADTLRAEQNLNDLPIRNFACSGAGVGRPLGNPLPDDEVLEFPLDGVAGEMPGGIGIDRPNCFEQLASASSLLDGQQDDVCLVLVSAGANTIGITTIIDPLGDTDQFINDINEVCGTRVEGLLTEIHQTFPNANIIVTGYYPIVSKFSFLSLDFQTLAAIPMIAAAAIPNLLIGLPALFFAMSVLERRSRIWVDQSNNALAGAVDNFNQQNQGNGVTAGFARSRIRRRHTVFALETRLWSFDNPVEKLTHLDFQQSAIPGISPEDERDRDRMDACRDAPDREWGDRVVCQFASVGHPNLHGAQKYSESVVDQLREIGMLPPLVFCERVVQANVCDEIDLAPCQELELLDCWASTRMCPTIRCNRGNWFRRSACRVGRALVMAVCRPAELTAFAACELLRMGLRAACDIALALLEASCRLVSAIISVPCFFITLGQRVFGGRNG